MSSACRGEATIRLRQKSVPPDLSFLSFSFILGNVFQVLVFKKEKLTVHCESKQAKEQWLSEFEECQKFASTLGLKVRTNGPGPNSGPPVISPAISVTPSNAGLVESPFDPLAVILELLSLLTPLLDQVSLFMTALLR